MANIKLPFRDIQVEYTRTHPLTKMVVIGLIVVCTAALITLGWSGYHLRQEIAQLRKEAAQLAAENAELREKIDVLDSIEGVENVAQEELEMVDPDTIIIDPNP